MDLEFATRKLEAIAFVVHRSSAAPVLPSQASYERVEPVSESHALLDGEIPKAIRGMLVTDITTPDSNGFLRECSGARRDRFLRRCLRQYPDCNISLAEAGDFVHSHIREFLCQRSPEIDLAQKKCSNDLCPFPKFGDSLEIKIKSPFGLN
jgi:hypothetical protein